MAVFYYNNENRCVVWFDYEESDMDREYHADAIWMIPNTHDDEGFLRREYEKFQ